MKLNVYLAGEIHSDWREEIQAGCAELGLNIVPLLKEVGASVMTWATSSEQVIDVLKYVVRAQ